MAERVARSPSVSTSGSGSAPDTKLRSLHVDKELRLYAGEPFGGVQRLHLRRRLRERHMGEVEAHAGHAVFQHSGDGLRVRAFGAESPVEIKHFLSSLPFTGGDIIAHVPPRFKDGKTRRSLCPDGFLLFKRS